MCILSRGFAGVLRLVLAIGMVSGFGMLAQAGEDPLADARWIRDTRFSGEPVHGVFELHEARKKQTDLTAVHTFFRKQIELAQRPTTATLYVTGDDYYKFYINGRFVVQGPSPAYPFAHPYYKLDVTSELTSGENCLAAHVYYHGLVTRAFNSADNRSGFLLKLELTFPDGRTKTIVSDHSWKHRAVDAFGHDRVFGYATQFNENIDMRRLPEGWQQPEFNDDDWSAPLVEWQDHKFVEQLTPPLEHSRAEAVVFKGKAPGRYFLDFGGELTGHTRIRIKGPAGHVITLWHGEELSGPETVRHDMRCNCDYVDRITLSGKQDLIELFDYRGFRYVELIDCPEKPEVWVDVRHHPFPEEASSFDSSNPTLKGIWEISKRGVQMGCQEIFVDCPTREKGQYTGDTYMTVLSQLLLTADPTLTRKALVDYHHSQRFDDGMLAVAPGGFHQELAEWSLCWPLMLDYYYRMTGDRRLVEQMVEAGALEKLFAWFEKLHSPHGLLTGVDKHKWVLVDWPANLRGGYDYEQTKNAENTVINAFYYGSLRAAARLTRVAGLDGDAYDERAKAVRDACNRRLLVRDHGIYRDGDNSEKTTLHASAFPLHFGLVPRQATASVVDLIRRERLDCGLYAAPYVLAGLYRAGEGELAYELLTCNDKHSWHEMLASGATTSMEAWAPELKWNTSWCHPACGTPVWLIVTRLMGLEPAAPGWRRVRLAPQLPEGLEWVELEFPTVAGPIEARYHHDEGYTLTVPKSVEVDDQTPDSIRLKLVHRDETH